MGLQLRAVSARVASSEALEGRPAAADGVPEVQERVLEPAEAEAEGSWLTVRHLWVATTVYHLTCIGYALILPR